MSEAILGIQINQEIASEKNAVVEGNKVVFCSEVIEHVENPADFLRILKAISGDSGYLILTTPNADFVKRQSNIEKIKTILAPSQHLFLLSAPALKELATSAGFKWTEVWHMEERLFLIAGPQKVQIENAFSRSEYIGYLEDRLQTIPSDKLTRYRCFGYRLFKEYVNTGEYLKADQLWNEITDAYSDFSLDLKNPKDVSDRYTQIFEFSSTIPNPKDYPFNLPHLMYFRAILLIAHHHDRIASIPYFEAAIKISQIYTATASTDLFQVHDLELQSLKNWSFEAMNAHGIKL
jgi:Methyltransferase domain